jgi:hypothetical protein
VDENKLLLEGSLEKEHVILPYHLKEPAPPKEVCRKQGHPLPLVAVGLVAHYPDTLGTLLIGKLLPQADVVLD